MARGPQKVQPEVAPRPLPGVFQSAPGGDFGQAQALQTQQAAQTLLATAERADRVSDRMAAEDNETRARELDAQFNKEIRGLLYDPEKGYYAKRGKDAYDATVPTLKTIDEIRTRYLDQAGNQAQRNMLDRVITARADGVADGISRHAAVQRLAWQDVANKAVADDAVASGATFFNEEKTRQQEYFRGRTAIVEAGEKAGQPEELTIVQLKEFDNKFHSGVVRRYISSNDPQGAQRYYEANLKSFTGDAPILMERELKEATLHRQTQNITALVTATGGVSPNYNARVTGAEGGTNAFIENKIGALGKYQFTKDTYTELAQATEWGKGKSQSEIRALLLDPKEGPGRQDQLQGLYVKDSTTRLGAAGVPVNDLTLYTTHFLGRGAGPELLKLPDSTPLQAGLIKAHGGDAAYVQKVNEANPFLAKVQTVGDLKVLMAQKIGAPQTLAVTGSPEKPNLDAMLAAGLTLAGDNPDLRDRVANAIKADYSTKLAIYAAQKADLEKQALAHIDQGGTIENLPPQIRGGLDSDGLGKVAVYEEKRLERKRKVIAEQAGLALADLERLNQLTEEDVVKQRNNLPEKEYRSWLKTARGNERTDDSDSYERLQRGLGTRDLRDDIFAAHNSGDISSQTRNSFLEKNATFLQQGAPSTPYRLGHDYVMRSLDPGLMGAGISRQTAAAGIKEYDQYVAANPMREGETPEAFAKRVDQFAQDTVKRYSLINTQEMAISLPVPANTPFDRPSMSNLPKPEAQRKIIDANLALQKRFADGLITEDQYNADAVALLKWLDFVQKRPDTAATPAPRR